MTGPGAAEVGLCRCSVWCGAGRAASLIFRVTHLVLGEGMVGDKKMGAVRSGELPWFCEISQKEEESKAMSL